MWVLAFALVQLALLGEDACLYISMKLLVPMLLGVSVAPTVDGM